MAMRTPVRFSLGRWTGLVWLAVSVAGAGPVRQIAAARPSADDTRTQGRERGSAENREVVHVLGFLLREGEAAVDRSTRTVRVSITPKASH